MFLENRQPADNRLRLSVEFRSPCSLIVALILYCSPFSNSPGKLDQVVNHTTGLDVSGVSMKTIDLFAKTGFE